MKTVEQKAYETWVGSFYGDFDSAVMHGYHTWEKLPDKVREAWKVTVDYIVGESADAQHAYSAEKVNVCSCYIDNEGKVVSDENCKAHGRV